MPYIRQAVEGFYADIWNRCDRSRIPDLISPEFTFRGSLGEVRTGHDGFVDYMDRVHRALGEYRCEILDLVVEEPKAFARMRFSGEHRGELLGYPPTGRRLEWMGAALFTFSDGLVADLWVLGDTHGLRQHLDRNAGG